jgi:hypothetical protein
MNEQELRSKLPAIMAWIDRTLAFHQMSSRTTASFGIERLADFYPREMLASTRVVMVPKVPLPPLAAMGLSQLADFEAMEVAGITYLNTYFVQSPYIDDRSLHFHELVHVAQWAILGAERFLLTYALEHIRGGYASNPFEVMAYDLQAKFENSREPFDVVDLVRGRLEKLLPDLHCSGRVS